MALSITADSQDVEVSRFNGPTAILLSFQELPSVLLGLFSLSSCQLTFLTAFRAFAIFSDFIKSQVDGTSTWKADVLYVYLRYTILKMYGI